MTMETTMGRAAEAARDILRAVVEAAQEAGEEERVRLGRNLTEAEAGTLAAMIERQLRLALAIGR